MRRHARRHFRPALSGLETRLCLDGSPWTVGPFTPPATHSGADLVVTGGLAILTGSNNGDTVTISDLTGGGTEVDVSNANGTDAFTFPSNLALEVSAGGGTNTITSTSAGTEILIGGTGDNTIRGGSGFAFEVTRGAGANTLYAGTGYTAFIAASSGSTHMVGGGAFDSASLCLGTNTFDAGAQANVVYAYGGANAVNADASDPLDVYEAGGVTTVNANGNPNVRTHAGLF